MLNSETNCPVPEPSPDDAAGTGNASSVHELAMAFRNLSSFLQQGGSPEVAYQRLVDLASRFIPGVDWAALTSWPERSRPRSLACSDPAAQLVDELQYDVREGPCLEAAHSDEPVICQDVAHEDRWPAFSSAATASGEVGGILAYHLTGRREPTALNLYAHRAHSFDAETLAAGSLFAAHASALLAHAESTRQVADLGQALSTSRQIGAAVGILMSAHKISERQAFELLKRTSNMLNLKLRDIARDITDTGRLPGSRG